MKKHGTPTGASILSRVVGIFIFVSCMAALSQKLSATPVEWPVANGGNGHFYEYAAIPLQWNQAKYAAVQMTVNNWYGHLATITSQAEQDWVSASLPSQCPAWLGGYWNYSSGWNWVTGESWSYTNWNPGEPSGDGNYLEIMRFCTGEWNDVGSTASQPFLVEYEAAGPEPTNLLTNPSFEIVSANKDVRTLYPGSTALQGWIVTRDQIDWVSGYWSCSDGMCSIDLDGSPGAGGVAQVVSTVPGANYELTFDLAGNFECGSTTISMQVAAAGQVSPVFSFATAGHDRTNMGWIKNEWSFQAVGTSTTIEFYSLDSPGSCGPVLDNAILTGLSGHWKPSLEDVDNDQGGQIRVTWGRMPQVDPTGVNAITAYEVQRYHSGWDAVASVVAENADSYTVTLSTPDVLTVGEPPVSSNYRVVALTADPALRFESEPVSGYSIDNLPPAAPQLELYDTESSRTLVWQVDDIADVGETCLYRDAAPGFEAANPIICSASSPWYIEDVSDLRRYYYRARTFDIHGNASPWSAEVVGRWPTPASDFVPTSLRLYPCRPNPFNPRTTIKYDLPEAGAVRLAVFDLAGRLIRTLVDDKMSQGGYEAVWDGRDASGREVGSGSYLARLDFDGTTQTIRMGLVR